MDRQRLLALLALGAAIVAIIIFYGVKGTTPAGDLKSDFQPVYVSNNPIPAPFAYQGIDSSNIFVSTSALPLPKTYSLKPPAQDNSATISLSDIEKKIFGGQTPAAQNVSDILPLPQVSFAELAFDPNGVGTADEYIRYFTSHAYQIAYPPKKIAGTVKNASGIPLLPVDLVESAIASDTPAAVKPSLAVFHDYLEAKINFLKTIKVKGDALAINRNMIGLDRLTVGLIDKMLALDKPISQTDFPKYYAQYKRTVMKYNKDFSSQIGFASPVTGFLERAGLLPTAYAQSSDYFGGKISMFYFCTCSGGVATKVNLTDKSQKTYFISIATLLSPLMYLYKSPLPTSWIMGQSTSESGQCQFYVGEGCTTLTNYNAIINFAGTSRPG